MIQAALYARVSTAEQAQEGYSIGEQEERLKKYADAMGWNVYKMYTDAGWSGGNMERPALQEMIADVEAHKVDKVVVYKQDRLSRDQFDTLYLIEKVFLANGVDFLSMTESFDTSTPQGKMMISFLAMFAEFERNRIKERMMMGKSAKAKTGAWMGSYRQPRGYEYINGELIIYEPEASQIQEAYDLLIEGKPLRTIENIFYIKGYRQRDGMWTTTTLSRVLKSRVNIGEIRYQGEWYPGNHEPLISVERFNEAQEVMGQNASRCTRIRRGRYTHYLSGMVVCARCGAKYGAKRNDSRLADGTIKKRIYFICYSRSQQVRSVATQAHCDNDAWREDALNEIVFQQIRDLRANIAVPTKNGITPKVKRIESIQKELKSIEEQSKRLLNAYMLGAYTDDELVDKKKELDDRKSKLTDILSELAEKTNKQERAIKLLNSFDDVIETGDFNAIRGTIEGLIDTIYIDGNSVNIMWRF